MCFIIAVISFVFAFNTFMAGRLELAVPAVLTGLFFLILMYRNIIHVKKLKEKEDKDDH